MKTFKYLIIGSIFFLLAFFTQNLQAQTLSPDVIASGGDYSEYSSGSLSWTVGEPVTETVESSDINVVLTQGFHQPEITITSIKEPVIPGYEISIYPNPTVNYVNIEFAKVTDDVIAIQVYDLKGDRIISERFHGQKTMQLDLGSLASANYLLSIRKLTGELISTYQISKTE